jgi:hypothetical protein
MRLDPQTVYQIFWLSHAGTPKTEIALRLRLARNTVTAHLSGRLRWQYDRKLRHRIALLTIPPINRKQPPPGMITLAESSYFFERRPTPKSILNRYELRIELVNGANFTTVEWAQECARKRNAANLEGVCMTRDAAKYLYGIRTDKLILPLLEIDSSDTPASLVSAAVGIMAWTQQDFVTLDSADVMRLVG